jgi:hypothetical protein
MCRLFYTCLLGPALKVEFLEIEWKLRDGVVSTEASAHLVPWAEVHDFDHLVHPSILFLRFSLARAKVGVAAAVDDGGAEGVGFGIKGAGHSFVWCDATVALFRWTTTTKV